MDTVLITGGAGFIGSNLVRATLTGTDYRVVVVDKLTYAGRRENLDGLRNDDRLELAVTDIADREAVAGLFRRHRPVGVLNLAAETHVDRSIDGPRVFIETNCVGTFELLEAARLWLVDQDPATRAGFRFLHVSTDEVFGSLGREGHFHEDTPYDPSSPYSASKAAADHLARAYHRTFGMHTLVTNCSNNYGPFQHPEKLIPLMILNAVEGRDLPVYGDGSNVRDWIYVDDHCGGLLEVFRHGEAGETYNLGGNSERTNLETVSTLCDILEEALPAAANPALAAREAGSYRDLVSFVADRPGHDQRYAIDASKAKARIGWAPSTDFETGLRRTVEWYLAHRDWCSIAGTAGSPRRRLGLGGS